MKNFKKRTWFLRITLITFIASSLVAFITIPITIYLLGPTPRIKVNTNDLVTDSDSTTVNIAEFRIPSSAKNISAKLVSPLGVDINEMSLAIQPTPTQSKYTIDLTTTVVLPKSEVKIQIYQNDILCFESQIFSITVNKNMNPKIILKDINKKIDQSCEWFEIANFTVQNILDPVNSLGVSYTGFGAQFINTIYIYERKVNEYLLLAETAVSPFSNPKLPEAKVEIYLKSAPEKILAVIEKNWTIAELISEYTQPTDTTIKWNESNPKFLTIFFTNHQKTKTNTWTAKILDPKGNVLPDYDTSVTSDSYGEYYLELTYTKTITAQFTESVCISFDAKGRGYDGWDIDFNITKTDYFNLTIKP